MSAEQKEREKSVEQDMVDVDILGYLGLPDEVRGEFTPPHERRWSIMSEAEVPARLELIRGMTEEEREALSDDIHERWGPPPGL